MKKASFTNLSLRNFSSIKKSILIMFSGNVFAQLLLFGSTPILTRLYEPDDFGVLASFTSVLSILLTVCLFSFEKTIPLVKNDRLAINIVLLSIIILLLFSTIIFVSFLLWGQFLFSLLNMENITSFFWLIPISLLAAGAYQVFNYYLIRLNKYKAISLSKINQSFYQIVLQISMSFLFGSTAIWLLLGDSIGRSAGVVSLMKEYLKSKNKIKFKIFKKNSLKWGLVKYKTFALQSTASGAFNTISLQMPILLIGALYDPYFAGIYLLSQKVIGLPITLITKSIGQVYYGEAASRLRDNPKSLYLFYKKTVKKLLLVSILPFIIIALSAPTLFGVFLGEGWVKSGEFVQLLTPMFISQVAITPLAQTLTVIKKVNVQLWWEIGRFLILLIGIILPYYFLEESIGYVVLNISVIMSLCYVIFHFLTLGQLKKVG
jgi:O-antigen/teichoic acid export membrane protein